jgi:methylase of polypeptide subunit release factors
MISTRCRLAADPCRSREFERAPTGISAVAVRNTRFNFDAHGLHHARVLQSDLLDEIADEFDLILFSAPYYGGRPKDWLERASSPT